MLLFSQGFNFVFLSAVPALQLLGVLPLAVMKATMSKLVEPQEQGKSRVLAIYTIHPGGNVRCKYSKYAAACPNAKWISHKMY